MRNVCINTMYFNWHNSSPYCSKGYMRCVLSCAALLHKIIMLSICICLYIRVCDHRRHYPASSVTWLDICVSIMQWSVPHSDVSLLASRPGAIRHKEGNNKGNRKGHARVSQASRITTRGLDPEILDTAGCIWAAAPQRTFRFHVWKCSVLKTNYISKPGSLLAVSEPVMKKWPVCGHREH